MSKAYRQGQILKLVRSKRIMTQDDLARELWDLRIAVSQETLSRDIRDLSLVKTTEGYKKLADEEIEPGFTTMALEFMRDVRVAQNLVVLKTAPGNANALAAALDKEQWPEVIGTIAGDDTILVIAPDNATAGKLVDRFFAVIDTNWKTPDAS
jgi:transcriptional regulator of arginine metabolism